jgi:hypothetical protein
MTKPQMHPNDFWNMLMFEDDCLIWTGGKSFQGYGQVQWNRRQIGTHRLALLLVGGTIEPGQIVLHACDNRLCCHPNHLTAGSYQDNTDDMVAKGRSMTGERNGSAKLTAEDVRSIRASPRATRDLAHLYKVAKDTIRDAKVGRTWKSLI